MSEMIDGQRVTTDAAVASGGPTVATAVAAMATRGYTPIVAPAYTPIVARVPIAVRPAVMGDLAFIDRMQKQHSRELGFLPTAALEGKIRLGQVLVAEATRGEGGGWRGEKEHAAADSAVFLSPPPSPLSPSPVGYLIAADRYQKRDEIGYVTQINVVPEYRRSLVAAQLLQAQFDRSAYGCRLYCCWCAQDLKANEFWEAMGFTAIAFRTGSMKKMRKSECGMRNEQQSSIPHSAFRVPHSSRARVHIFWQKRIRAGDSTTPWWYPSQTGGGELREDRLVFPIMPGVHWREVGPIVLEPTTDAPVGHAIACREEGSTLTDTARNSVPYEVSSTPLSAAPSPLPKKKRMKVVETPVVAKPPVSPRVRGGMWMPEEGVVDTFKTKKQLELEAKAAREAERLAAEATTKKPKKPGRPAAEKSVAKNDAKIDPRLTAMSRELRDQWTERAEAIVAETTGKHDVKRIAQASTGANLIAAGAVEPLRLERAA